MPRKKKALTRAQEKKLVDLMSRGRPLDENVATLKAQGVSMSRATLARRMREVKGKANAKRAEHARASKGEKAAAPPLPATDEEIENATPGDLDRWLETANRLGSEAEDRGDFDAVGKMGRLAASLLEHKRKAAPPPKHDKNEDPDYVELGERVAAKLHEYVDRIAKLTGLP